VAGDCGLAEFSAQSVHARELPGLFVRRAASEPRFVWPAQRTPVCGLVPEDLVGEVRRAVDNGRALQDLLVQAGPRYVKALKRERASAAKRTKG
jgi:hypothetical protein